MIKNDDKSSLQRTKESNWPWRPQVHGENGEHNE